MPVQINVTTKRENTQFNIFYTGTGGVDSETTNKFDIYDKAKVCFRTCIRDNKIVLEISLQKSNVITNATKMNIICRHFGFAKEFVCPEFMSDWIFIGALQHYVSSYKGMIVFQTVVNITTYKYTASTEGLVKFFNDLDLTDFHLSTEECSRVAVHRAYLAARSDVFKTMLSSKWKETDEGIIEMKGLTLQTLKHLKEYLYLGNLPEDADLRPLLLLASQYCIEDLKDECISKLARTVLPENLYSLLDFACDYKLPGLCLAVACLTPDDVINETYDTKKAAEEAVSDVK